MHTVSQAAALLGVTRTTVYKYVNRDRKRYTSADADSVIITDEGLRNLRIDLAETMKATRASADIKTATTSASADAEIARLSARVSVLEAERDAAQKMVDLLNDTLQATQKALDQEQQLRLHEVNRPGFFKRLLGK